MMATRSSGWRAPCWWRNVSVIKIGGLQLINWWALLKLRWSHLGSSKAYPCWIVLSRKMSVCLCTQRYSNGSLQKKKSLLPPRKGSSEVIEELPVKTPVQLTYDVSTMYCGTISRKTVIIAWFACLDLRTMLTPQLTSRLSSFDMNRLKVRLWHVLTGEVVGSLRVNERVMCSVYDHFGKHYLNNLVSDGNYSWRYVIMEAQHGWLATFWNRYRTGSSKEDQANIKIVTEFFRTTNTKGTN